MFGERADKTKPLPAPEGYRWYVEDTRLNDYRFALALVRDTGNLVEKDGRLYRPHGGDSNFKKGALIPARLDAPTAYFDWPSQMRSASKRCLRMLQERRDEELLAATVRANLLIHEMEDKVNDDNP